MWSMVVVVILPCADWYPGLGQRIAPRPVDTYGARPGVAVRTQWARACGRGRAWFRVRRVILSHLSRLKKLSTTALSWQMPRRHLDAGHRGRLAGLGHLSETVRSPRQFRIPRRLRSSRAGQRLSPVCLPDGIYISKSAVLICFQLSRSGAASKMPLRMVGQ